MANTLDTACNQAVVVSPTFTELGIDENGFKVGTFDADLSKEEKVKHSHRIRRLTPLECMRLQGFPDEYIKPCSDTQTYKQAGNSITVNVMKAIIKNLLPIILQQTETQKLTA
jgi:site-specific DNA-cytosine methylase